MATEKIGYQTRRENLPCALHTDCKSSDSETAMNVGDEIMSFQKVSAIEYRVGLLHQTLIDFTKQLYKSLAIATSIVILSAYSKFFSVKIFDYLVIEYSPTSCQRQCVC